MDVDSDDYTTISENVTSDTSIVSSVISNTDEDFNISYSSSTLNETSLTVGSSESNDSFSEISVTDYDSDMDNRSDISVEPHSESSDSIYSVLSVSEEDIRYNERSTANNTYETRCSTLRISTRSGSSTSSGWEVINTFEWHSEYDRRQRSPIREFFSNIVNVINPRSHRYQEM
ncbi:unnamed protein product [Parnassius apollo]|uniref:(apollo) hypothetical protein n=1 Tax=Parnassius apollo TaxID=110799 RepID=A0A8S3XQ33_PARAO|nr:unnamed protein product [Parnassius apollo]